MASTISSYQLLALRRGENAVGTLTGVGTTENTQSTTQQSVTQATEKTPSPLINLQSLAEASEIYSVHHCTALQCYLGNRGNTQSPTVPLYGVTQGTEEILSPPLHCSTVLPREQRKYSVHNRTTLQFYLGNTGNAPSTILQHCTLRLPIQYQFPHSDVGQLGNIETPSSHPVHTQKPISQTTLKYPIHYSAVSYLGNKEHNYWLIRQHSNSQYASVQSVTKATQ